MACRPGRARSDAVPPLPPSEPGPSSEPTVPDASTASLHADPTANASPPRAAPDATAVPPPPAAAEPLTDEEAAALAGSINGFAADFFPHLAAGTTNAAFSPASLAIALGMTSAGARTETAEEMSRVLHLGDDPDRTRELLGRLQRLLPRGGDNAPIEIFVANRLFGEQSYVFERPFLDLVATQFAAPLEPVDFRSAFEPARTRINAWVSEQTRGRIPLILPEGALDDLTRLVLVNAICFKGSWAIEFDEEATTPRPFTLADGSQVDVPTMGRSGRFGFARRGGAEVLELPYRGGELSMVVVLPPEGAPPDGWATAEHLAALGSIPETLVHVRLPRFTIDAAVPRDLKEDLAALGMPRAFECDAAQFEGIGNPPDPTEHLYLGAVYHEAFVVVDEKGTEAVAATSVVGQARGGPPGGPQVFWANRPFLFFLREQRTGLILFAGRVGDPRATS